MSLDEDGALTWFADSPIAYLATITESVKPHLVPITFALSERSLYTMVDHKPKRSTSLKRLANISANNSVSILVDHYDSDWTHLWWVRLDGLARVEADGPIWDAARRHLAAKYPQYQKNPPTGPAITVTVTNVTWWQWSDA